MKYGESMRRILCVKFIAFYVICAITFFLWLFYNRKIALQEHHDIVRFNNLPWYFNAGSLRPFKIGNASDISALKIWPHEDRSDRIAAQLMTTSLSEEIKTIFVDHLSFNIPRGRHWFIENQCPVDQCEIVHQDRRAADAVIFKDSIEKFSRNNVLSSQVWILFVLESPYHSGFVDSKIKVNWTASYRSDSDIVAPYEKWMYYNPKIKQIKDQGRDYAQGKTKKVAWFVSNCDAKNLRLEYARELGKYIEVDIYGSCGNLTCPREKSSCDKMLKSTYKFYLSFENSNCREYITEKFFVNALSNDILPIVMGAHPHDYKKVAPEHSYIHVDDFSSPEDLANYLKILDLDDELYNRYFYWKGTGEFINTRFFCRVCAMLHQKYTKHYTDFRKWWSPNWMCRTDSWIH